MTQKTTIFLIIAILLFAVFFFNWQTLAAKEAEKVSEYLKRGELIANLKNIWQDKIVPLAQDLFQGFKENIWARISEKAKAEIEKRKIIIEEELPKEKEEIEKEAPILSKTLWQKFREFIKK